MRLRDLWHDFDWTLFGAILVLSAISLIEIYSATKNSQFEQYAALKQLIWICIGIGLLFIVAALDYHIISEQIPWLYMAGIGVLVYTLALGRTVSGSKSWIVIGPMRLQPSELVKVIVIVAVARYLSELRNVRHLNLEQLIKAGLICGIPVALVAMQPDLGTTITFLPILGIGLLVRGIKPMMFVVMLICFVLALPIAWRFLGQHQRDRITNFVNPEQDLKGSGYQVNQSKIAIGSGGALGKGIFKGSQNQLEFLPTRHTDFILAVVAEEMGFVGVALTLGLLGFILFRAINTAQTARDELGLFIVMGVFGIYFFHTLENVGMVIGFMPMTGIPLPFMSYGGSSIIAVFMAMGLVIGVRRRRYVN
jgi:rod shape determining protein RodA